MSELDPRIHPIRTDLAAASYRDRFSVPRYAEGRPFQVAEAIVPLRVAPEMGARRGSELLQGETVTVYEERDGWSWVQNATDQYMGYVPTNTLGVFKNAPTHRVTALRTVCVPHADIKAMPSHFLSFGTLLSVTEFVPGTSSVELARLANGSYVVAEHIAPLTKFSTDWPQDAEKFLGAPYVWGGRSSLGIDCSGLVQLALAGAGIKAPRDSDLQGAYFTNEIGRKDLRRGDLVYWQGHAGLMLDAVRLLHATAYGMCVRIEPLDDAVHRILGKYNLPAFYRRP